jgi:hypothetical protein
MPPQQQKSVLASKIGARFGQIWGTVKETENTRTDVSTVPPGINNGIAQLTKLEFGEFDTGDNKGKPCFKASAVIVEPLEHNGIKTEGMQIRIWPEPLFDTSKKGEKQGDKQRWSEQEHWKWVKDFLEDLGLDPKPIKSTDDLEKACQALMKSVKLPDGKMVAPFFKFRTWQGKKQEIVKQGNKFLVVSGNYKKGPYDSEEQIKKLFPNIGNEPLVNVDWGKAVEYTPDTDAGRHTEWNGPTKNGETQHQTQMQSGGETQVASDNGADFGDIDSLFERAQANDTAAFKQLSEMAVKSGYTQDEVDNADWDSFRTMILTPKEVEQTTEPEQQEIEVPEKGQTAVYSPPDPKQKGKFLKPANCEIVNVDTDKQTVELKNLANKAVYKAVPWTALIPQE